MKKRLMEDLSSRDLYFGLISIFEQNNETVKRSSKERLQKKFKWLTQHYNKKTKKNTEMSQQSDSPVVDMPTIDEPVDERVTAIQVQLSPEEKSLLALGPKFALTPKVDENMMDSVRAAIAACAYRLRWISFMGQTSSCPTLLQHLKQQDCPFQRTFVQPPPTYNVEIEDSLKQLNNFILKLLSKVKVKFNSTHDQAVGFKLLKSKKSQLHISVSDKGGEFVVMNTDQHKALTEHHLTSPDVYQYVPPTRRTGGTVKNIKKPTEASFSRQIKSKVENLETTCNELWASICQKRGFNSQIEDFFKSHNTRLPTMYVQIKTHKFDVGEITPTSDLKNICKVRPIVSCCGSPTEKMAWIVTTVLSPLLDVIPSHLKNICSHLKILAELTPQQLKGWKFCCADVSSLYTNINILGCIDDIMTLATENKDILHLYGLQLVDIHQMLEIVFGNAYFTFNNKMYIQVVGLFMGCKPSPIGAITRMYMFERNSIYIDVHYLPLFYGRYVDDSGTLAQLEDQANKMFNSIASQDPDRRLGWEVDFPQTEESFTPFLSSEVMIDKEGVLHHKFYRKKQKKQITIHFLSHHPFRTKVEVIKQFYKTAAESSSTPEYITESYTIIDHLLRCNGYSNPRQYIDHRLKGTCSNNLGSSKSAILKLPFISDAISEQIRKFIRSRKLPINVLFQPGVKLRDIFCSSRPHDGPKCTINNCRVCSNLPEGVVCTILYAIYLITCRICLERYIGETLRESNGRLSEHIRCANNPTAPSYRNEALAVHYREKHPGMEADLKFEILRTEPNTLLRKIYEAFYIFMHKPEMNDKSECKLLERFLVEGDIN